MGKLFGFVTTTGIILLIIFLSSCTKEAQQVSRSSNTEFNVSLLFKFEGCKVYRFFDSGRYIYYTNCTETMTAYSCGKNCTASENIGEGTI